MNCITLRHEFEAESMIIHPSTSLGKYFVFCLVVSIIVFIFVLTKTITVMSDVIKKYPELDEIATEIANTVLAQCNSKTKGVKSEMPYKAQYVLEMIIQKLEAQV
jgi:hypothetical protein